jgi:hypothetical protein
MASLVNRHTEMRAREPLLDEDLVAFVQGGVSIVAASRDSGNVPVLARAAGCLVSTDRRRVTVLLPSGQAGALVGAVRSSGALAVVFSQPTTHRTVQLKGTDAAPVPLEHEHLERLDSYPARFAAELVALDYKERFARTLVAASPDDVTAIAFSPTEAFTQTPGPEAGEPLRSRT